MLRMTMHNTANLEYPMDGAMEFTLTASPTWPTRGCACA